MKEKEHKNTKITIFEKIESLDELYNKLSFKNKLEIANKSSNKTKIF